MPTIQEAHGSLSVALALARSSQFRESPPQLLPLLVSDHGRTSESDHPHVWRGWAWRQFRNVAIPRVTNPPNDPVSVPAIGLDSPTDCLRGFARRFQSHAHAG